MAKFQEKSEFLNANAVLMQKRMTSQYSVFLESKPSFTVYYHINTKRTTVDKGLLNTNSLTTPASSVRYNKIKDFPVYINDMVELSLNEEEYGLDTKHEGNCIILPHTIHPLPDDYFIFEYLERPFLFRITHVEYDTIKSNSFFRCQYELRSLTSSDIEGLDKLVVQDYSCVFDNIGTSEKSIILDDEFEVINKIRDIQYRLREEYLTKFRSKEYNALMYFRDSLMFLYDPVVNDFCNKERVFEIDMANTTDSYLLYTEKKTPYDLFYENSIYDRLSHLDCTDLDKIGMYYDMESAQAEVSIFQFNHDERVKYLRVYNDKIGPFGNELSAYIPHNFIEAIKLNNDAILGDNLEKFVYLYMRGHVSILKNHLDMVDIRRMPYDLHSYIFIPMVLFCLKKVYENIITDTSVMDEHMMQDERMKKAIA